MENPTTIAIDLSKNVFEIAVERQGRVCQRKRLNRRQTITFLSQCPRATVLMETCGSSHYWGRLAQGFGHAVELLPAQHVKPYRIGNKTDRRDVEAIPSARHRESTVPVTVKTVEQQTVSSLNRVRSALMKTRTARLNTVRGRRGSESAAARCWAACCYSSGSPAVTPVGSPRDHRRGRTNEG